jgi:hypothetical protein
VETNGGRKGVRIRGEGGNGGNKKSFGCEKSFSSGEGGADKKSLCGHEGGRKRLMAIQ